MTAFMVLNGPCEGYRNRDGVESEQVQSDFEEMGLTSVVRSRVLCRICVVEYSVEYADLSRYPGALPPTVL